MRPKQQAADHAVQDLHQIEKVEFLTELWEDGVDKFALLAILQAKTGKEDEVEKFLKSAQPLAAKETGTTTWYAVKLGGGKFGIFDTFQNEEGRNAHLTGEIAKALFARAEELFATPPQVEKLEILASKSGVL